MQAPKIYKFLCLLFLLSLVSFLSFSSAHASDYWIKTFGTDSWEGVSSNDSILPTSDGNYILTGSTEGDIFVTKIDPSGNIISNTKFDNNGKNDEPQGIIQTSDNGYLVIGRSRDTDGNQTFIIFKLNSSFQVEWAKEIGEGIQEVKGIIEETNTYVVGGVICQSQTDCDGFIASLNKFNGSLTNMKTYGSSDVLEGFLYLTKAPDGNYISAGVTNVVLDQNGELQYADIWVMKINSSDYSIAWQYQYGPGFAKVVKTSTGGIVFGGSIGSTNDFLIMRLDSSGAVQWAKTYGGTQYDELMDLVIDADGNIVAVGGSHSLSQDQKDGVILKVSGTDGGIIWQRYFNSGNPGDIASSIALSDTGYIVAGEYGINYQDVIVLRIDSDGNIDSTCASIYQTATFNESSKSLTGTQTQATSSDASINPNDISLTTSPISFLETQQCPSVNYTLTVSVTNPEYGYVWSSPSGINCGQGNSDCSEPYFPYIEVTLSASPNFGYGVQWGGDCAECVMNNSCTITMDSAKTCTAEFIAVHQVFVMATGNGFGSIISDPAGISFNYQENNTGSANFTHGSTVILTATASTGSTVAWTTCSGTVTGNGTTQATCTFSNLDGAKTAEATFTLNTYTLTVTKSGTGSGTVSATGCTLNWNDNSGTCTADHGTSITLSATANTGSTFTGWSNGTGSASSCTGTGDCTFTITEDSSVTATFTLKTYTVTPVAGSGGTITPDTPQTVTHGSTINITATASTGYHVAGIIGCGINYTNTSNDVTTYTTTTAPIISDCTVTATFDINHFTITTTVTPAGSGTVTCSPNPVNYGSSLTCTITPTTGYHIDSVSGTCGGTLNGNIYTTDPITSDCTVVANFTLNQYQVTANAKGNGSGSIISNPAGINFNYPATNSGSANFDHGTNVVLTATASTGSTVSWTNCSGTVTGNGTTQATCTFSNLDGAKTVEATFTLNTYTLTVTKSGTGSGTVNATGCTLSWNGNTGTCTAGHGTSITLSATANTGSTFTGWSGGTGSASNCTGTGDCTFTITENSSVTATFTAITAVKLLSPNGGEVIPSGSSYTIQWQAPANADHYTLKLSMNNGMTWSTIASNITGNSYDWNVPIPRNNKSKCFIKVIAFNASNVKIGEDSSDGPFTIEVIKLNTPNGGETLTSGSTYDITWTTKQIIRPVSKVILSYTLDGGFTWKAITTYTDGNNPGTHPWTVPTVSTSKTKCKVKVVLKDSAGNTIGSDVSDYFFTISPQ